MNSNMSVVPANVQGLHNVTILGGCRRWGRRKIGVLGDEFFAQNFAPLLNDTIRKYMQQPGLMNSV